MKSKTISYSVPGAVRVVAPLGIRLLCLLGLAALLVWPASASAALVGPAGYTNSFEVRPAAADWSTRYIQGAPGDVYDLTNAVEALAATNMNVQLLDGGTADPATARANAFWTAGAGGYVATRPAADRCTLLMVTLLNDSGTNASGARLSYDLGVKASSAEPDYPGLRAFYSLNGLSNSWAPIPELSSSTPVAGTLTADLSFATPWLQGANLYVLWVDDNANNPSSSVQDPAYTIDNFFAGVTGGLVAPKGLDCTLNAPGGGAVFVAGNPVTAAASPVRGIPPYTVEYFTNSGAGNRVFQSAGVNGTAPYNVSLDGLAAGTWQLYAVATDSAGTPVSATSLTNSFLVLDPISVTLIAPANGATFQTTNEIVATAAVSGGTAPYSMQYYLDNAVQGAPVTEAPYAHNFGILSLADHTLQVSVTDARGWRSNSAVSTIHVNGPVSVTLAPANGTTYNYGQPVTLTASLLGGLPPFTVMFHTNGQVAGSLTAAPFSTNFGVWPAGSYTSYVSVVDATPPAGYETNSSASVITILPNPLGVVLTSPASGYAGLGLTVSAAVTVGAPLTVSRVEFFADGAAAGVDTAAPFSVLVSGLSAGSHAVYAVATDSLGRQSFTRTNQVTMEASSGLPIDIANCQVWLDASDLSTLTLNNGAVTTWGDKSGQGHSATAGVAPRLATNSLFTGAGGGGRVVHFDGASTYMNVDFGSLTGSPYTILLVVSGNGGTGQRFILGNGSAGFGVNQVLHLVYPGQNQFRLGQWGNDLTWTSPSNLLGLAHVWTGKLDTSAGRSLYLNGSQVATLASTATVSGSQANGYLGTALNTGQNFLGDIAELVVYNRALSDAERSQVESYLLAKWLGVNTANVALTSPTNGAIYGVGSPITLNATASAAPTGGGSVTQVAFYASSGLIGVDTSAPYSVIWSNAPLGTNRFYAVMNDSAGLVQTSAVVTVRVLSDGVVLLSPADGTILANTNPVTVSALGLVHAGAITNVAFFLDGQKFAEDGSAPFSVVCNTLTSGSHRLTAAGQSDTGMIYNSPPVYIGVAEMLVRSNSVWKYLDNGSDQGTNWIAASFNDSAWASGPAELGYGDGGEATVVAGGPTNNYYITTYFRRTFVVSNAASYSSLQINVRRDDGAVVYLNGVETGRYNMSAGAVTYTTLANNAADDGIGFFPGAAPASLLVEGANVLAVEIHQTTAISSDISFDLEMSSVPRLIRNESPAIVLTSPANMAYFLVPTDVTLAAAATDADGAVVKVQFFLGDTQLSEATNPPYALTLQGVPAGAYTFTAAATDDQGATTVSAPATIHVYEAGSRWVAFNDHYAGPGTHPNATAWNAFGVTGGAPGDEGTLRDITTGSPLPAFLTVAQVGAFADPVCGAPAPGTPAYAEFNGYVDFGSGGLGHAILVTHDSLVMHLFTGLDPQRLYRFRGAVVGGVEACSNRWTLCTLAGAQSFIGAHTANVLTSLTQPALAADEAAFNSGDNRAGDVVGWDNITPGPDGSFMVLSTQYLGPAPGNARPGLAAYAPVAVRLEETSAMPFVQLTAPLDGAVITGPTNVTLAAAASAIPGIASLSFFADGVLLGAAAGSAGSLVWTNPSFGDHVLLATTVDSQGFSSTSAPVLVRLITPPTNTVPPLVVSQAPLAASVVTSLASVRVLFSEPVIGVDASDLLINDAPATSVAGSGSNFLFSFVQPPYGPVRIRFAADHNITDVSWPLHLAFYENEPQNSWTYELVDRTAPVVAQKDPAAGAALTNLVQITVTFSEAVSGVNAADLLVNGTPAYEVSGSGATYAFSVSQPASGTVNVTWAASHGIADQAVTPTPFNASGAGAVWSYTLDAKSILVESNSSWRFVKGTNEASFPANAWRLAAFDDAGWSNAPAPFFYGDPYSNGAPAFTLLSDMRSNYTTIYLRKSFVLPNAANITNLFLRAQSDDGFIAWINGVEVYRYNVASGEIPSTGVASSTSPEPQNNGAAYNTYTLPDPRGYLVSGANVLAVQAVNEALSTSSDFGFNAQLYTYQADTEVLAPRLVKKEPAPGYVLQLTNLLVTFSEPVTHLEAADLLVNGVPASTVEASSNTTFLFHFPQPAYGPVAITWAANHGIVDLDISPKPFHEAAAGATWQYILLNAFSPYLVEELPAAGAVVNHLTQVSVLFSEPVSGVDAGDLLVNGAPALSVTGSGMDYTFTFPQPAYGAVAITWAASHGIQDFSVPPESFDPSWPAHAWTYTLVDQTPPAILAQDPPANSTVHDLTQLTVTFTEPVTGVDAADLLLNGKAASGVAGTNATYTFTFAQPNGVLIHVTWAADHGIRDRAAVANAFAAASPSASWSYSTTDRIPPAVAALYPPAFATVRFLTNITVTFDEPVRGLDAEDLLLNNAPALRVSGSGAGPYIFVFASPPAGQVQVAWAAGGDILDFATPANFFAGGAWTYNLDPGIRTDVAVKNVIHLSLDGAGGSYLQAYMDSAPSLFRNFSRLRREGASTLNARCDSDISVTLPNHTGMFTGRPALQPSGWESISYHGLTIDSDNGQTVHTAGNPNVPYKVSTFDVVHDHGLSTAFLSSKQSLTLFTRSWNEENGAHDAIGENDGDNKLDFVFNSTVSGSYGPTPPVVDEFIKRVETNGLWNYTFMHFDDGDAAGHASGWGSTAYSNAILAADQQIGRVLTALQGSPAYANRAVVIITADHGGSGNGHFDASVAATYTVPVFLWGAGVPAGVDLYSLFANRANPGTARPSYADTATPQPLRNVDTGNLAMAFLGLPQIPGSRLIPLFGVPEPTTISLRIVNTGESLIVSWPLTPSGYELQTATRLGRSANWTTLGGELIRTNGTVKEFDFWPAANAPASFFRLRKP